MVSTYQHDMEREELDPAQGVTHHVGDNGEAPPSADLAAPLELLDGLHVAIPVVLPYRHLALRHGGDCAVLESGRVLDVSLRLATSTCTTFASYRDYSKRTNPQLFLIVIR